MFGTQLGMSVEQLAAYGKDWQPNKALPLPELVAAFNASQEPVVEGLRVLTPAEAAKPAPFSPTDNPDETVGTLLALSVFHEAYHAGQIGILRRMSGKAGLI
jgi:uncharacterized damage-inducible protein DinB